MLWMGWDWMMSSGDILRDCRKSPKMVISAISRSMKSITYKHQNYGFRVFRQSLRITQLWQFCRYDLYITKQNPTSQFEKQGLGILSIITFHRLLSGHQLNVYPERLPAYMGALAFWSSRCYRQIQIKWLIRPKIFFSSLFSLFIFCLRMKLSFQKSTADF